MKTGRESVELESIKSRNKSSTKSFGSYDSYLGVYPNTFGETVILEMKKKHNAKVSKICSQILQW